MERAIGGDGRRAEVLLGTTNEITLQMRMREIGGKEVSIHREAWKVMYNENID